MTDNTSDDRKRTDTGGERVLEAAGKYKLTREYGGDTYRLRQGPVVVVFADSRRDGDTLELLRSGEVVAEVDVRQVPDVVAASILGLPVRTEVEG